MDIQIIHIVLGKANPNKMNGVNKVVNELATSQTNLGYAVSVWGITKSQVHNYPRRNYRTDLFMDKGMFSIDPAIRMRLESTSKNTIFHFHGGFIPQFYFVAKVLVKMGFKYVFTPHGAYNVMALERSKLKKKVFLQTFDKFVVKNAKRIHFIGQSEVGNGLDIFGSIPYSLIPNGQPLDSQMFEKDSHSETNEPVFGFMGRLDIYTKGLDLLFAGFKEYTVNHNGKGVLWVIGDGTELPKLKEMAQNLGISHLVDFKGSLFGEEKEMALKKINIFCLTSRNEGLPGVVLEAASHGIPSIVSKATNVNSYLEKHNSGWVLEENSETCIAKTLATGQSIFSTYAFDSYRENAFAMLQTDFNWTNIAKAHIREYEK
ncbi:MAG: glycosyltransferase [Crocinitomicaceae bacterium]